MFARVCTSVAVLLCVYLLPARIAFAANGPESVKYFGRAWQIVLALAAPKLRGNFEGIAPSGPVKLTYRVRASGALASVRVTSGNPNSFMAQTFVNAIRSAKFPPIPKAVLKEQGKNWIDIDTSFETLDNIRR